MIETKYKIIRVIPELNNLPIVLCVDGDPDDYVANNEDVVIISAELEKMYCNPENKRAFMWYENQLCRWELEQEMQNVIGKSQAERLSRTALKKKYDMLPWQDAIVIYAEK